MADSFFDGPIGDDRAEENQRLREALEAKTRELEDQQDRYLRTVAEFDNVRKRAAREREEYTRYANESVLRDLLPVLDNLDRAMQAARSEPATSLTTGVELIQRDDVGGQGVVDLVVGQVALFLPLGDELVQLLQLGFVRHARRLS